LLAKADLFVQRFQQGGAGNFFRLLSQRFGRDRSRGFVATQCLDENRNDLRIAARGEKTQRHLDLGWVAAVGRCEHDREHFVALSRRQFFQQGDLHFRADSLLVERFFQSRVAQRRHLGDHGLLLGNVRRFRPQGNQSGLLLGRSGGEQSVKTRLTRAQGTPAVGQKTVDFQRPVALARRAQQNGGAHGGGFHRRGGLVGLLQTGDQKVGRRLVANVAQGPPGGQGNRRVLALGQGDHLIDGSRVLNKRQRVDDADQRAALQFVQRLP